MPTQELVQKYIEEICPTCKNKECNFCKITVYEAEKDRGAKCEFYERVI